MPSSFASHHHARYESTRAVLLPRPRKRVSTHVVRVTPKDKNSQNDQSQRHQGSKLLRSRRSALRPAHRLQVHSGGTFALHSRSCPSRCRPKYRLSHRRGQSRRGCVKAQSQRPARISPRCAQCSSRVSETFSNVPADWEKRAFLSATRPYVHFRRVRRHLACSSTKVPEDFFTAIEHCSATLAFYVGDWLSITCQYTCLYCIY